MHIGGHQRHRFYHSAVHLWVIWILCFGKAAFRSRTGLFYRWPGSPGMRTGSRIHPPCSWKKRARIGEIKSLTSRRFFGFGKISCVVKTFRQNNSIHIPLPFHWSGRYIKPHLPRNGFNNDCYVRGYLFFPDCAVRTGNSAASFAGVVFLSLTGKPGIEF